MCVDELYVRTHHVGAANVGWRNLALLPTLRTRVLRAMRPHVLPPTPADSPARPLRLLFTREDAGSRRLIVPDPKHACAVLGAQLLRRMPSTQPLREQALLYAGAAAVISPHGAASVNAVFLRRGAVFIELHATCATHCASGCFPKHRSGPRGELSLLDALELPAKRG